MIPVKPKLYYDDDFQAEMAAAQGRTWADFEQDPPYVLKTGGQAWIEISGRIHQELLQTFVSNLKVMEDEANTDYYVKEWGFEGSDTPLLRRDWFQKRSERKGRYFFAYTPAKDQP